MLYDNGELILLSIGGFALVSTALIIIVDHYLLILDDLIITIIPVLIGLMLIAVGFTSAYTHSQTVHAEHNLNAQGFNVQNLNAVGGWFNSDSPEQATVVSVSGCEMTFDMSVINGTLNIYVLHADGSQVRVTKQMFNSLTRTDICNTA